MAVGVSAPLLLSKGALIAASISIGVLVGILQQALP